MLAVHPFQRQSGSQSLPDRKREYPKGERADETDVAILEVQSRQFSPEWSETDLEREAGVESHLSFSEGALSNMPYYLTNTMLCDTVKFHIKPATLPTPTAAMGWLANSPTVVTSRA